MPALDIVVIDSVTTPSALVLESGTSGPVIPAGLLDESATAAVQALLDTPLATGTVRELPRPGQSPARLFLAGLGDDVGSARRAGAALARAADDVPVLTVAVGLVGERLTAFAEGMHLAAYRFGTAPGTGTKTGLGTGPGPGPGPASPALGRVEILIAAAATPTTSAGATTADATTNADATTDSGQSAVAALAAAAATRSSVSWARDVTNTRAQTKHPAWLAERAVELLAPLGVDVVVRDEVWLAEQGFGGLLAVGGGSDTPPRLVEAHWRPEGVDVAPVLVVGKGITYDTGGYNLKPGSSMGAMYTDMAGGAAALAALATIATRKLRLAVSVLVPLADNAVSAAAYRPGDVVTHRGGRTTEITNTDAEGRIVLADALAYGVESVAPRFVVDIATLTGAMRAALGDKIAGVVGDDDGLVAALIAAGKATGESLWRLPLAADEYQDQLKSPVADAVNSTGNPPGAITAALFLRPFAGGVPWAHLDIAGTARSTVEDGVITKGATGFGARLLARWLESLV